MKCSCHIVQDPLLLFFFVTLAEHLDCFFFFFVLQKKEFFNFPKFLSKRYLLFEIIK